MKKGEENKIEEVVEIKKDVKAPVKKGDVLGEIVYKIGDETLFKTQIKASDNVEKAGVWDTFVDILTRVLYGKAK